MGRDNFVAPTASGSRRPPMPDILGAVLGDTGKPAQVAAGKIKTDGGTQMRAGLDDATVFEYGQAMIAAGGWGTFPAVICYHDGRDYWLADGFHRVAAFLESFPDPKRVIPVEVRAGTRRDAVLHAAGANASHGLRRTNEDKRRAVDALLRDEEWGKWSNTEIARRCVVSESTVRNIRAELEKASQIAKVTDRKGADGKTYNTANIGSKPAPVPAPPVYTPITIAGNSEPQPGTPIPPFFSVSDAQQLVRDAVREYYTGPQTAQELADRLRTAATKKTVFWMFVADRWPHRAVDGPNGPYDSLLWVAQEIERGEFALNTPAPEPPTNGNGNGHVGYSFDRVVTIATNHVQRGQEAAKQEAPSLKLTASNHVVSDDPNYDGDEWYTPAEYIEAARQLMGGIDLDPASSDEAQEVVQAGTYFTKQDNGLTKPWFGCVWLNPPYSMPLIRQFVTKLIEEYDTGNVTEAVILTNNSSDTAWFHDLLCRYPACFTRGRVQFWRANHETFGARQGQTLFYLGENITAFRDTFARFGLVVTRL